MKRTLSSEEVFRTMTVPEAIRAMAVPSVVSQLIVLIYNLADTYFIGQTGNPSMVAGVSLILPLFNLTLALGSMFGSGGGALLPKLLAGDRRDEGSRVASFCIRMAALLAVVFSLLMLLFMRPVLMLLGAGENTYAFARTYVMMVLVAGGLPTILSNVLSSLLRSLSLSREAGIGVALGGVLNILLDPLFMFVLLPPGNEVLGVGLATLISNVVSALYCLFIFCRRQREIPVSFANAFPEKANCLSVFTVGIPGTLGALLFDIDYMVLNRLISGYGDVPLAAMGIVLKAERFPQQVGIGLCLAIVPLVAYSYALKDDRRIREIIVCTVKTGLIIAGISIAVYQLFSTQIVRLFIGDSDTLLIGTRFLRVRSVNAAIMFFCFFVVFLFQGFGNGKISSALAVMRWLALNIPMMFLFRRLFGMYGIVWAQLIADFLTAAISFLYLSYFLKQWELHTSPSSDEGIV